MAFDLLVAGAGIGGLAAGIAARRAGCAARVVDPSSTFEEAGAGLQLGPNATALLRQWPVAWQSLQANAAVPAALRVRDAGSGRELGLLGLGTVSEQRHGAPYWTLHRSDLHGALRAQAQSDGVVLQLGAGVDRVQVHADSVEVQMTDQGRLDAQGLIGADGLWSQVRAAVLQDGPPLPTGQLAYRTVLRQRDLAPALRSNDVTAWLGRRMHAVTYPVRGGEWLNLVCLVEGSVEGDPRAWGHEAVAASLHAVIGDTAAVLRDQLAAAPHWRLWVLHDRPPLRSPGELVRGRVALLGDAAHPMLPYLAQGAGMAIEDAWTLQQVLSAPDLPAALQRYARLRWQRCARVQARSRRNAWIFHAQGPLRLGRNLAMRVFGESLLDLPWLYRGV
jgi:salicylate hydroxylase